MIIKNAAKATANPATFKKVATLKRINTLMKLRMIVFITYSILLILKSTQKEYSLNKMADIHSFQDIQRNLNHGCICFNLLYSNPSNNIQITCQTTYQTNIQ